MWVGRFGVMSLACYGCCMSPELKAELDKRIVQKPSVPPKPKVILQRPTEEINALEHVVAMLR